MDRRPRLPYYEEICEVPTSPPKKLRLRRDPVDSLPLPAATSETRPNDEWTDPGLAAQPDRRDGHDADARSARRPGARTRSRSTSCPSSGARRSRCSTFYGGMPAASIEKNITSRMERGVVQASGGERIESRSIVGASIVRDYFGGHVDRSGALTESASLAGWEYPTMPPGTLPPVDPPVRPDQHHAGLPRSRWTASPAARTGGAGTRGPCSTPGRYEVRPMIMSQKGALAPLVYGGKVRAVMVYLDRQRLQARHLAPLDVLKAIDDSNVFLPTGSAKFGDTDYAIDSNSMFDLIEQHGRHPARGTSTATRPTSATSARPRTPTTSRPTSCGSTAAGRSTSPSSASSAPARSRSSTRSRGARRR